MREEREMKSCSAASLRLSAKLVTTRRAREKTGRWRSALNFEATGRIDVRRAGEDGASCAPPSLHLVPLIWRPLIPPNTRQTPHASALAQSLALALQMCARVLNTHRVAYPAPSACLFLSLSLSLLCVCALALSDCVWFLFDSWQPSVAPL